MIKKYIILFILIYSITSAQTAAVVDVNNFYIPFNNKGILADVNFGSAGSLARYPGSEGKGIIFSAGFYLSGYKNEDLFANGAASSFIVEDYLPGNIGTSPSDPKNIIYTVKIDDPYYGKAWQNWKNAVNQGAYYYDGNGNGYYDPIDHNGNGIWEESEDRPDLLFDATYFTVYNDSQPRNKRRWNTVEPIGIEIRQTLFASGSVPELQDVIFIRYSILYKGLDKAFEPDTLNDIIFSVWTDMDIGNPIDDLIGCDTLINSAYGYNNGPDTWYNPGNAWGESPPAIFRTILQGPPIRTDNQNDFAYSRRGQALGEEKIIGWRNGKLNAYIGNIGGFRLTTEADNPIQARNHMEGLLTTGEIVNPCDFLFGEILGGLNCDVINPRFWYSGDPVIKQGWLCKVRDDKTDLLSTENFTLIRNQPVDIIVAYTVGHGTDHLSSITDGRNKVRKLFEIYEQNFPGSYTPPNYEEIYPKEFSLSQNYPNPFNPSTTIKFTVPLDVKRETSNTKLVVYDILGREVKTLVNENRAPGSYEITFDASQLASGVYFYRLTSGDFMQTKKMILIR
jgi:hypothetical protein